MAVTGSPQLTLLAVGLAVTLALTCISKAPVLLSRTPRYYFQRSATPAVPPPNYCLRSGKSLHMDMGLEIHKLADASFIEQMHGLPDRAWSTKANFQCTSQPIPKIIHFVWMGSQLPPRYCAHVQLMADTNPTWKVHLWADHPHVASTAVNATNFEVRDVMQYAHMFRNWDLILNATNLAGKADYLRMEVVHL